MATVLQPSSPAAHEPSAASANHHHHHAQTIASGSSPSSYANSRRMSRPPPPKAAAEGWEDDVVPTLRRRLEAESAYLSQRLSTQLAPSVSPSSPQAAAQQQSLAFPSSSSPSGSAGAGSSPTPPSKIPVSPLSRARSKSRGASSGLPATSVSSRALQDVVGLPGPWGGQIGLGAASPGQAEPPAEIRGSSYNPHKGESGSSSEDGAAELERRRVGVAARGVVPIRSSQGGSVPPRQRTKSTPFANASSGSPSIRSPSAGPARALSPDAQSSRLPPSSPPSGSAGVLLVGSSALRAGMKPLYLAQAASTALPSTGRSSHHKTNGLHPPSSSSSSASSSRGSTTPTPTPQPAMHDSASRGGPLTLAPTTVTAPLTPSPSPSPPLEPISAALIDSQSYGNSDHSPSLPDSALSQATRQTRVPSDRLIRDEVAPFQILSRDLRAVRADGRVELGAGDGFTERELVRQMPSVWRSSGVPSVASSSSTAAIGAEGGSASTWEAEAERLREEERANEARKQQARRQELLEIARNGWELDDHLTQTEDRAEPFNIADMPPPALPSSSKGMSSSATTGHLASAASSSSRRPSHFPTETTTSSQQPPSSAAQDEQEARRRRREEGAQRQRALSTGGRRAVRSAKGTSPSRIAPVPALPAAGPAPRRTSAGGARPTGSNGQPTGGSAGSQGSRRTSDQAASKVSADGAPSSYNHRTAANSSPDKSGTDPAPAEDDRNSIRLSLYGEDAVPPMAADKPTRDELMNWDSVVIPAARKKKKHNPLLEWDDSISNPSSTPPSKGARRDPYTPPSASSAGPAVKPLSFGEEVGDGDWPPPAPGTFGYKPPRSRTTTGAASCEAGEGSHPLQERTDPANAGARDPLSKSADDDESDVHSPAPSSSVFDGSTGQRRMSKARDRESYHPQVINPVTAAQKQDEKLAAARRQSTRSRIDEEAGGRDQDVVGKSGCCGGGCVIM